MVATIVCVDLYIGSVYGVSVFNLTSIRHTDIAQARVDISLQLNPLRFNVPYFPTNSGNKNNFN